MKTAVRQITGLLSNQYTMNEKITTTPCIQHAAMVPSPLKQSLTELKKGIPESNKNNKSG